MKKRIVSIFIGVILALTLTSCAVKVGIEPRNKIAHKNSELDKDETLSLEDIDNININIQLADVQCKSFDENNVRLIVKNSTTLNGEVIMKKEDKNLNIEEKKSGKKLGTNNYSRKIEIYIPKEYKGDIYFENGVGDIKLEEISCENLSLEGGTGDLDIYNINAKDLTLNSGVGDIRLNLNKSPENMNIGSGTGDCDINIEEVNGNLVYDGGVGDVTIRIPENAPVKIKSSSGVGYSNIDAKISDTNKYTFDLDNSVGEIKVTN
ncbi:Hypothetical protein CM240_3298 [Clostridium bornimense]|uniref:DUF4097 domain-containing protein n=1 Tax=Clostridium bornimense TaxID=1216932 RepID=W6SKK6_9CLOT|nr:DUF4097 family beta strand repeat-containing protein [Clostridium bornimense]CDM70415.1 Hypothetical protein CM240_3298 [Clostridium bornimense]